MKNTAFENMKQAALQRLCGKAPEEIGRNTGIRFSPETSEFCLSSLGKSITVKYPEYSMAKTVNEWHQLVILHYMDMADRSSLTGKLIRFGELPGGMVRGGGFDRLCEQTVSRDLGNWPEKKLGAVCRSLGGRIFSSNADFAAEFSFLPFYPVTLKIWFADEEMAGSGRMFLDSSAGHFLSVEDAVTVGTLLLEEIQKNGGQYERGEIFE